MVRRRRIKDRSWRIDGTRFVEHLCPIRLVEPNGKYLILERLPAYGSQARTEFYKMDLKEGGVIDTSFIEPVDLLKIFDKHWAKKADSTSFRRKRDDRMRNRFKDLFDSNLWRDGHKPLFSPDSYEDEYGIPYLSIDDGKYVLTEVEREGEEGEGYFLAVREIKSTGKPVEIDLDWPRRIRRNKHKSRPDALGTLHSKDTYAIIFEGKRIINVFRNGEKICLPLEFGEILSSDCLRWSLGELGSTRDHTGNWNKEVLMWMGFNRNGSRLITVSYLPYHKHFDKNREETDEDDYTKYAYRWEVKSWDIDGRVEEMARTRLRLDGKWKKQAEHAKRTKSLASAGLPFHVAYLISRHGLSDREGISIFNRLREGGIPGEGSTDNDPLKLIDELVFSRRVSPEDGRFLVENRNHVDLVSAIADGSRTLEWARWLLLDRGFFGHPEATSRIIAGADVETVAMVERITSAPREEAAKQIESADTEEFKEAAQDEPTTDTESREPFWKRKSRFT